jgi:hypothetical protein
MIVSESMMICRKLQLVLGQEAKGQGLKAVGGRARRLAAEEHGVNGKEKGLGGRAAHL